MRHADEAILNAYLDGELDSQGAGNGERRAETVGDIEAHLASCTECSALLEEVKRVRHRASEILSASTPVDIEIPPFDEIRARSEARNTGSRVLQLTRIRKLAWAATIVVAVAVGWYARGTVVSPSAEQSAASREQMTAPQATTTASEPDEQGAGTRGQGVEGEEQGAGSEERRLEEGAATVLDAELDRAVGRADRDMSGRGAVVESLTPAEVPVAEGLEGVPSRAKAEPEAEAVVSVQDQVAQRQRRAQAPSVVAQKVAAEPAAPTGGVAVDEVLMVEDSLWVAATEADAQGVLGGDVPTVAGLPIVDYSVSMMQGRNVVRVRQRLDDDNMLDLIVSRATPIEAAKIARRDELAANEPKDTEAANTITLLIGEYEVLLRGRVADDSLRVLGERIR